MTDNEGCLQNKKNGLPLITKYNLDLPEEKKFKFLPMNKHMVYQRLAEQLIW